MDCHSNRYAEECQAKRYGRYRLHNSLMESRLAICKSCEQLLLPQWQCKICGCLMQLKARIPMASCPLGKW